MLWNLKIYISQAPFLRKLLKDVPREKKDRRSRTQNAPEEDDGKSQDLSIQQICPEIPLHVKLYARHWQFIGEQNKNLCLHRTPIPPGGWLEGDNKHTK